MSRPKTHDGKCKGCGREYIYSLCGKCTYRRGATEADLSPLRTRRSRETVEWQKQAHERKLSGV